MSYETRDKIMYQEVRLRVLVVYLSTSFILVFVDIY